MTEARGRQRGINVAGRRQTSPLQGFGQMWQKTYRVRDPRPSASPREVIVEWKAHFPEFWPKGNHFFAPLTGINPGEVARSIWHCPAG